MHRTRSPIQCAAAITVMLTAVACAGQPSQPGLANRCETGLEQAHRELDLAKAKGFSGTVEWAKAASLLSAATVQKQFEKYPNCVEKVKRARYYIRESQK